MAPQQALGLRLVEREAGVYRVQCVIDSVSSSSTDNLGMGFGYATYAISIVFKEPLRIGTVEVECSIVQQIIPKFLKPQSSGFIPLFPEHSHHFSENRKSLFSAPSGFLSFG